MRLNELIRALQHIESLGAWNATVKVSLEGGEKTGPTDIVALVDQEEDADQVLIVLDY